jgi:hypothetical protein
MHTHMLCVLSGVRILLTSTHPLRLALLSMLLVVYPLHGAIAQHTGCVCAEPYRATHSVLLCYPPDIGTSLRSVLPHTHEVCEEGNTT